MSDAALTEMEARVLACLVEKESTTPDYYPMTINALTNACNQKSNRDPVVTFTEEDVGATLNGLQQRKLTMTIHGVGSRVLKYGHRLPDEMALAPAPLAILVELVLRGPQTLGELRTRASRMHKFQSLEDVKQALQPLMDGEEPKVIRLARQPGRKENRFAQILTEGTPLGAGPTPESQGEESPTSEKEKSVTGLENEVKSLRAELEALKAEFREFRLQKE